jgi:hypothetical protein
MEQISPIIPSAIFTTRSTIRLLYFWNASGKAQNWTGRTFDERQREMDSILRSISEAGLISVFQTWFKRLQQVIHSAREYISRTNFDLFGIEHFVCDVTSMDTFRTP